jgi:hypothetical protein
VSAAALDAQLTALSTGTSWVVERPGKPGFPHEFMLHRNEFDRFAWLAYLDLQTCLRLTIGCAPRYEWW